MAAATATASITTNSDASYSVDIKHISLFITLTLRITILYELKADYMSVEQNLLVSIIA